MGERQRQLPGAKRSRLNERFPSLLPPITDRGVPRILRNTFESRASRLSSPTIFPLILRPGRAAQGHEKKKKRKKETRKREKERERKAGRMILGSSNLWTGLFIAPVGAGFTRSPITEIYGPPLHPALPSLPPSLSLSLSLDSSRVDPALDPTFSSRSTFDSDRRLDPRPERINAD